MTDTRQGGKTEAAVQAKFAEASPELSRKDGARGAGLEGWLECHRAAVAIVVLGIGFLIRIRAASYAYLVPDEVVNYVVASQPSLVATYKLSVHEAHPPLTYFLLHFWRLLGHSELMLRLPSVLAGTVLPWFVYKWLKTVFGARTGWIGLLLLTFSPAIIVQSVEDRQYALLLFFLAAALYFLERALGEDSVSKMALFALFLFLAIATHFSTLWFAIVSGVYALGRIRPDRAHRDGPMRGPERFDSRRPDLPKLRDHRGNLPSRAVAKAWLGSMAGAAALFVFFYVTQISRLRSSGLTSWMANASWISGLYFHPGKTGALEFALGHSAWFFEYLSGQEVLGFVLFALFLISVSLLLDPRLPLPGKAPPRLLALLLFLPFLMASGAGLAQLYPYGPVREDLWLAPFAIAGVSYGLSQLGGRRRAWPGLCLAAIVIVAGLSATPVGIVLSPGRNKRVFEPPVNYIRQAVPQNQPILTDISTMLMLGYYLCNDEGFPYGALQRGMVEYRCGGFRFVVASLPSFAPANFLGALGQAAKTHRLRPGQSLWVAHAGWGDQLQEKLAQSFPELRPLPRQNFNEGVAIFQVEIPQQDGTGQ